MELKAELEFLPLHISILATTKISSDVFLKVVTSFIIKCCLYKNIYSKEKRGNDQKKKIFFFIDLLSKSIFNQKLENYNNINKKRERERDTNFIYFFK